MKRRNVLSLLALAGVVPAGISEAEDWCTVDPAVPIKTPGGNNVVVYEVNGGPTAYKSQLMSAKSSYEASPAAGGTATDVELRVQFDPVAVPDQALTSQIWTGPGMSGSLLSSQNGTFGSAVVHKFRLHVP